MNPVIPITKTATRLTPIKIWANPKNIEDLILSLSPNLLLRYTSSSSLARYGSENERIIQNRDVAIIESQANGWSAILVADCGDPSIVLKIDSQDQVKKVGRFDVDKTAIEVTPISAIRKAHK